MSRIKEIKQNEKFSLNYINVLELFCPDKKSKYIETLLRVMLNTDNLNSAAEEVKQYITKEFDFIKKEDLNSFSNISVLALHKFIDSFFNYGDLKSFRKFCEYNERGLIEQNDLTKYKTFNEILTQLSIADIKVENKSLENEVVKVFENDEWILIRPLTHYSSKKYGANTKWCTTMESNPEYFYKYSKRGVLIYCINKKTGYKVASFYSLDKNDPEFSFWNQQDQRVDSLETQLTDELRSIILKESKNPNAKTNRDFLSEELKDKEEQLYKIKLNDVLAVAEPREINVEDSVEESVQEIPVQALRG